MIETYSNTFNGQTMDMQESFEEAGFLSRDIKRGRHNVRAENREWFQLAYDVNTVLMRIVAVGMGTNRGTNWSQEAVTIRLLMRTTGAFQGAIKLSELGMIAPARTLVRTIIEDSFCAAAIQDQPQEIIEKLKQESEENRRKQANFISENELTDDPETLSRLKEVIRKMEKAKRIDWKKEAMERPLWRQYLNYMRLSDDSVHTSALSLDKHVARSADGSGWSFKIGPGQPNDIKATLHRATLAALPVGIVVTNLIFDQANNAALRALGERFRELPTGNTI